jgi:ABC transporter, phosphonate, periplasmic substrate-binding protein
MTADRSGAPLRFATFLAPNMLPVYLFLADQITHRLGRPVQLVGGSSFDQFEQGEADFGVICGLPYVWLADRLRIIDTFGPSTIQPVVAASRLPEQLKDGVRELLVGLGDDASARLVLDHGFIQGFTAIDAAAYDDIRTMLATIQAAGWTDLATGL